MTTKKKFPLDVTIIPAYCRTGKEKMFGIRTEKMDRTWVMTWTFRMTTHMAVNENYLHNSIGGRIAFSNEYPGCPYCGAQGFYQCGNCKKIICDTGTESQVTCPGCGAVIRLETSDTFDNIAANNM